MAQHAVHRAIQEGLTNARKHAPGQPVSITVREAAGAVDIEMRNPTPCNDSGADANGVEGGAGGYGLVGLRERVELSGGRMSIVANQEIPEGKGGEEFGWSIQLPLAHKEATR